MKKILMLALLFSFSLALSPAFADDPQYTIEDIWMQYPYGEFYPSLSEAFAVNDNWYVVGRLSPYPGQFGTTFLWHEGNFLPIDPPFGGGFSAGIDINNSNQVIATAYGASPYRENSGGFIENGITTTIPYFAPDSIDSAGNVYGVGRQNESPGQYITPDLIWKDGSFVGTGTNPEPDSRDQASQLTNLKDKLAPGYDPYWINLTPTDINSSGQIVGYGLYGPPSVEGFPLQLNHAFIMTPIVTPEPTTMALFGIGGAALAAARRRKAKKSKKSF